MLTRQIQPIARGACAALLSLLAACGGGTDSAPTFEQPAQAAGAVAQQAPPTLVSEARLLVSERTCGAATVHDNGTVLYLIFAADCNPQLPLSLSFTGSLAGRQTARQLSLPGFDADAEVEVTPGEVRTVSAHPRGTWRSISNGGSWAWRDGAGLLAKDGGLYLVGGWNSTLGLLNDVWFTRNLGDWTQKIARAPWAGRHGAGWVVHDDRLYIVGGDLLTDVWSSADGAVWNLHAADAGFGQRYSNLAVSFGGRLLMYGGQTWTPTADCAFRPECAAIGFNDVWASGSGAAWTQIQPAAPWAGRGLIHGTMLFEGRLYLVGGGLKLAWPGASLAETVAEHNDVWSSSDGIGWRLESNDAGFTPRTHIATLATSHGCYVAGGSVTTQMNVTNEVYFAPDCVRYLPVPGVERIGVRHAASLVEFNGSVVMLGGHAHTAGTVIWQYFPPEEPGRPVTRQD